MRPINALLDEITYEMLKVILLYAFLDATILFLILLLLLSIFGIGVVIPAIVSGLFLIGDVLVRRRKVNLTFVEEQNPEIREMLRTAADNKDAESLMAHALFAELIGKMRKVSSGTFLDLKKLISRIGVMFVLSLVVVSLAFFNVNIQKFENPLLGLQERIEGYYDSFTGVNTTTTELDEGGLYGDPRIARLGDKQVDIQLQQSLNQIDFSSVKDADPSAQALDDYPTDVSAQASQAYTGGLEDINDRKTAAEYSQEIKS